jgi:nucleoside-diphosphate-sugar epimerase
MTGTQDPAGDYRRQYAGVRALVLGATGFIGRWVARCLTAAGADLALTVRDTTLASEVFDAYDVRGTAHPLDLGDSTEVRHLVQRVRPAITFNLAGYGVARHEQDEQEARRINAQLIATLCEAVAALGPGGWPGQALVHAGTAMEYGTTAGDLAELTTPHPTTLYGRSKLQGTLNLQRCCRLTGVKGLTARLFAVYGPGEAPERLLPTLIRAARSGDVVPLTAGLHRRDFVYVEDAADGMLRLGLSPDRSGEPVNVATGVLTSIRDFARTAAAVLGVAETTLRFGALPTREEEMYHDAVTNDRLRRLTGWTPRMSIADGVTRTASFLQGLEARAARRER